MKILNAQSGNEAHGKLRAGGLALAVAGSIVMGIIGIDDNIIQLLVLGLCYGLAGMSLDLSYGYGGMLSFGHAGLFGAGGYAVALLIRNVTSDILLCLLIVIIVGGAIGFIWGLVLGRLEGVAFAMGTLALGVALMFLAQQWRSVLGGTDGISGLPFLSLFGRPVGVLGLYYVALSAALMVMFGGRWLLTKKPGIILRAVRDNPQRARAFGINPYLVRASAQAVVGSIAALGGALFVSLYGGITPDQLHWTISGLILVQMLAGGKGTLYGPLLAAVVLTVLQDELSTRTGSWDLVLGLLIVVLVLLMPGGTAKGVHQMAHGVAKRFRQTHEETSVGAAGSVVKDSVRLAEGRPASRIGASEESE